MGNKVNLSNRVFGKLTVIKENGVSNNGKIQWLCKCECGKEKTVVSGNLIQKKSLSCGTCVKTPNLIGKRFGDLTVVKRIGPKKASCRKNKVYWLCRDDKGQEAEYCTGDLRSYRKTKIHKDMTVQEAAVRRLMTTYLSSAKNRSYSFNLTYEQFENLIFQNCHYCGSEPTNTFTAKRSKKDTCKYNGIDRKDNFKGYDIDNCVPCCRTCNRAKYFLKLEDWLKYIKRLVNYNKTMLQSL